MAFRVKSPLFKDEAEDVQWRSEFKGTQNVLIMWGKMHHALMAGVTARREPRCHFVGNSLLNYLS